jgi:hypothetical protein
MRNTNPSVIFWHAVCNLYSPEGKERTKSYAMSIFSTSSGREVHCFFAWDQDSHSGGTRAVLPDEQVQRMHYFYKENQGLKPIRRVDYNFGVTCYRLRERQRYLNP